MALKTTCIVIGIAGGSASGKTTFTDVLASYLVKSSNGVQTISADRFYLYHRNKSLGPRFISPSTGIDQFDFNHPDAIDAKALLEAIKSHSQTADVLLVEGLMVLQNPAIREVLDVRIFIELEADVRALRRMLRDMQGGRVITEPNAVAAYYLESARVGHEKFVEPSRVHADLIIRGDADFSRVVPILAAAVSK